jgi:periplasmic copper chaperone A
VVLRHSCAAAILSLGMGAGAFIGAAPAIAHVTVSAPGAAPGASDAVITFQVPDESDTATTVGLKLQLPTDRPIAGVLVAPMPGWTATITQTKLSTPIKTDDGTITQVVSEIDWTADARSAIKPGYFGEFTIIGGKLPDDATTLTFKAIQTYSDDSVVSWIEESAAGSDAEAEHPAPTLILQGAAGAPGATAASPSASTVTVQAASASSTDNGRASVAVVLAVIGVLLGAGALGVVVIRRPRRAR